MKTRWDYIWKAHGKLYNIRHVLVWTSVHSDYKEHSDNKHKFTSALLLKKNKGKIVLSLNFKESTSFNLN